MAEWMGKPRFDLDDLRRSNPSLVKHFPMLVKYFIDSPKMRVTTVLDYERGDKFKEAVTNAFGFFGPSSVHRAAEEALDAWIEKHLKKG